MDYLEDQSWTTVREHSTSSGDIIIILIHQYVERTKTERSSCNTPQFGDMTSVWRTGLLHEPRFSLAKRKSKAVIFVVVLY